MDTIGQLMPSLSDARILLVDDDPGAIEWMGRILAGYRELRFATSGAEALVMAHAWQPELMLLDVEMPGIDGFAVCRALKADPLLADVPVIFITQHGLPAFEIAAFDMGAADFVTKPVTGPALLARVAMQLRLRRMTWLMARLTARDALTGLADRDLLDAELALECARSQRTGRPLALLLADIDGFATYNRLHGSAFGDSCLRTVAQTVRRLCRRPADLPVRHGSDSFALLLPDTATADAAALAVRLSDVAQGADEPPVTLCIGLAVCELPAAGTLATGDLAVALHWAAESALAGARRSGPGSACLQPLGGADAAPVSINSRNFS
jgi:diguanylate cyclase (GGDEF)-like protein